MTFFKKAIFLLGLLALIAFFLFLIFQEKNREEKIETIKLEIKEEKVPEKNIEEKTTEKEIKIIFTGDLMLDRYYRLLMAKNDTDWITEKMQSVFDNQNFVVANLEGPITDKKSVSAGPQWSDPNILTFTFDPEKTIKFLKNNRINSVNVGNNHILNFGKEGLAQTENILEKNGISFFGDPQEDNKNYFFQEVDGQKIYFVNYNQFTNRNSDEVAEEIKKLKEENNLVVVYTHWGEEYQLKENKSQRQKAHLFIDSGADLIIGTHPHVVQPIEIYKNKAIFYSLGNFVFDQFFSEDTKNGLAVSVSISENKQEFDLVPLYNEKGQVVLADEVKSKTLLKRISENSEVDEEIKHDISQGKFHLE